MEEQLGQGGRHGDGHRESRPRGGRPLRDFPVDHTSRWPHARGTAGAPGRLVQGEVMMAVPHGTMTRLTRGLVLGLIVTVGMAGCDVSAPGPESLPSQERATDAGGE